MIPREQPMWCIVGLGNPGPRYRWSRHNVGFRVVDRICLRAGFSLSHKHRELWWGEGNWCGEKVRVAQPQTFMNLSGKAVLALRRSGCEPGNLVVVHDDMDLPLGRLKFKWRGGDAGHRGVRSVLEALGEESFLRLRIGIGRPPSGVDPVDFVLESFQKQEEELVEQVLDRALDGLEVLMKKGLEEAMKVCHAPFPFEQQATKGSIA